MIVPFLNGLDVDLDMYMPEKVSIVYDYHGFRNIYWL